MVGGSLGVRWLVDTSPQSLPPSSHDALPFVSLPLFFYYDISHIGLGSTLIWHDCILTWLHLQRLFPNKVPFTGPGG